MATVLIPPHPSPRNLLPGREAIASAIETLVAVLDALDGDPDTETDGDEEDVGINEDAPPNLGVDEAHFRDGYPGDPTDQEATGDELDDSDTGSAIFPGSPFYLSKGDGRAGDLEDAEEDDHSGDPLDAGEADEGRHGRVAPYGIDQRIIPPPLSFSRARTRPLVLHGDLADDLVEVVAATLPAGDQGRDMA